LPFKFEDRRLTTGKSNNTLRKRKEKEKKEKKQKKKPRLSRQDRVAAL